MTKEELIKQEYNLTVKEIEGSYGNEPFLNIYQTLQIMEKYRKEIINEITEKKEKSH